MLTPRYFVRTLAAGTFATIQAYGRYISVISINASTLTMSIDDEPPQQIVSGTQMDCEEQHYSRLTFRNTGGVPATLILILSIKPLHDMRGDALLAAMAASLAAIDIDTSAIDTKINISNGHLVNIVASTGAMAVDLAALEVLITAGNVDLAAMEVLQTSLLAELQGIQAAGTMAADVAPVGGAAAVQLIAANATRIGCVVQAMSTNAASIFVGFSNLTTAVNKCLELQPGQGKEWDNYRGPIYVYTVVNGPIVHGGQW